MFNRIISDPQQIPIPQRQRTSTDVCCTLIAALIAIILFTISVANFDRNNTSLVYFTSFNSNNNNISYEDYQGFKLTLLYTFIITISISIIWIIFVQFLPQKAPILTYLLAIISLITLAVYLLTSNNSYFIENKPLVIIFTVVLFIITAVLLISLCIYSKQIQFQAIMLKYSVRYLFQNSDNFLYLPLFLLSFGGLIVLLLFQHLGLSNIVNSDNNFFNFINPGFLGLLNVLQFFWGLQFLRDAFIFILSGNSVTWYWCGSQNNGQSSSLDRLISKNWGSVATGSFMNAFLRIPLNIIEQFICDRNSSCGRCGQFCNNNCNFIISFFGLIRTDSYSYINIFGTPYCDSGRQCQKLCQNSHHFIGFQSAMKNFRIVAGIVLTTIAFVLSNLILNLRVYRVNIWFQINLLAIIIGSMSFFASIHPSVAEGIQTSFLVESYLSSGNDYMQKCIPSFRKQLQALSKKGKDNRSC